jgi:hypothetical protein
MNITLIHNFIKETLYIYVHVKDIKITTVKEMLNLYNILKGEGTTSFSVKISCRRVEIFVLVPYICHVVVFLPNRPKVTFVICN